MIQKNNWPITFVDRVWMKHFDSFQRFYKEHKKWPRNSDQYENFRLGDWLYRNRVDYFQGRLSPERLNKFKDIGYPFKQIKENDTNWEMYLEKLRLYVTENSERWKNKSGYLPRDPKLRAWCKEMQTRFNRGSLGEYKKKALDQLDFPFQKKVSHSARFYKQVGYLKKYLDENPGNKIPRKLIYPKGNRLGNWCSYISIQKDSLSKEQRDALDQLNFDWSPNKSNWERKCNRLLEFYSSYTRLPKIHRTEDPEEVQLAIWFKAQKKKWEKGKLDPLKEKRLKEFLARQLKK